MRLAEYSWVFRNLIEPPARILDVGCITSYLPFRLLKLGYELHGIDTRWNSNPKWEAYVHPETFKLWEENRSTNRIKFKLGDIRRTDYPNDFFDQVIAVSTIEHIGCAVYDNPADDVDEGDFKAMKEIKRIVKPDGTILLTTIYGDIPWKDKWGGSCQARVYDNDRLIELLKVFEIIERKFYGSIRAPWPEISKEQAIEVQEKDPYGNEAIVCLKLVKTIQK